MRETLTAGLEGSFRALLLRRLEVARNRLDDLAGRACFRRPLERLREEERRLDDWAERLGRVVRRRLEEAKQRLEAQAARLEGLSPLNVLARGYSLTRREGDGAVVRSPEQVRPGERIVTQVRRGRIVSRVEAVEATDNKGMGEP